MQSSSEDCLGKSGLLWIRLVLCQDLEQYKVRKTRWFKRETRAVESVEKGRRLFHPSHSRAAATTRIGTDSAT